MANQFFAFKQFKIYQNNCANKISTDACVFGAIIGQYTSKKSVLDIGSGTGLLSFMSAQLGAKQIDGIEIEKVCFEQSLENLKVNSPFSSIRFYHQDIINWQSKKKYDCIISNPPFFNGSYLSPLKTKNTARQSITLRPILWNSIIKQQLKSNGFVAWLLANNDIAKDYIEVVKALNMSYQLCYLHDKRNSIAKRVILVAGQTLSFNLSPKFIYKNEDDSYTDEFKNLLKAFYLHL